MNSDNWHRSIASLIDQLEQRISNCENIDHWYQVMCKTIVTEMDKYMNFFDTEPGILKRFKYYKPYWDNELKILWQEMNQAHKILKRNKTQGSKKKNCYYLDLK